MDRIAALLTPHSLIRGVIALKEATLVAAIEQDAPQIEGLVNQMDGLEGADEGILEGIRAAQVGITGLYGTPPTRRR